MTEEATILYYDFQKNRKDNVSVDPSPSTDVIDNVVYLEDFRKNKVIISDVNADKLKYFDKLIQMAKTSVNIMTQLNGVIIPEEFKRKPILRLDWSFRFGIPDFAYDEEGIKGTLSFNGVQFYNFIPWDSVFEIWLDSDQKNTAKQWLDV